MGMKTLATFNRRIAEKITSFVSTMWCAYLFVVLVLHSLPAANNSEDVITIVDWAAQTFLQLVLLSIIMVGQKKSSESVEQMITETHAAALAEFELAKEAREMARQELAELKVLTAEMHLAIKSSGSGK